MATASTPGATENVVHDPITHSPLALRDWSMSPTASRTSSQESMTLRGSEESVAAASTDFDDVRAEWDANARKSKIQLAGVAGAASFLGATAVLALSSILRRFLSGWLGLVLSGVLCIVIAAVCAGSVVHYYEPAQPPIQLEGKETQLHKDKTSDNSPETALWFNTFLASLWPIVNPALFISIADMLEDELAATLPKFITGVRVADIGQGSQSIEIANISSLDVDESKHDEDSGQVVNLEVLVAYREHSHGKALKERSGNPHILMEFVLTGGVPVPVWIELTGLKVGARMRIGLMPNPPFLSSLVLTLLGKPKVTLKCTPLTQHFVNIMDIPVLSGWMQSAIDSAVAAYVAPHSLSMDLKTLLSGAEPMDTEAHGVVVVVAKYAVDFKDGDAGKFWESQDERHGDPYVSIGWGKWGKPIWSSRIIANEGKPYWEEIAFLLVGPSEMNAKERLRLQLWDSDRGAADDLLGSVEVNLHEIMEDSKTLNQNDDTN
ncbi:Meiotically up-regulated 190 protein [Mycena chlorophos]|uniref:Meiotically up-regulated 190 protein n=1 Tax=Mycena chlorophos TaxID=658473 RepID=A0A8H6T381_MYCCL|nr:Meiotically up-regulated 190 protein [Mycena chlorophos]